MNLTEEVFKTTLEEFQALVKKPESFLNIDEALVKNIKNNLKKTYDLTKKEEIKSIKSDALPELIISNFDSEQIWQQLELQNDTVLASALSNVSKVLVNKEKLFFKSLEEKYKSIEQQQNGSNEEAQQSDEESDNDDDDLLDLPDNSEDEEEMSEEESNADETNNESFNKGKKSIVDDQFFTLSEMQQFLIAEEKKLENPDSGNHSEDSEDEDDENRSIDLFIDLSDDEAKTARYKDYFVQKDEPMKKKQRNKHLEELEGEAEPEEDLQHPKSSLELRQERLQRKIRELEENAVGEKPWQLKGEITAESRPQNSLLEEFVEFDMTTRPAPVMTEQTTMQLEDIIKQRIKDKVFDSVERKARPVETPLEYKKKLVLEQEKSKQSLAQIYEKEFMDQQAALDPANQDKEAEEPQLHKDINTLMSNLFTKLDALSNFHFTPKPAIAELKIVSNLPAIAMEEVAPVAASDAALLAPEEVRNKAKGEELGKGERTATDKNRQRRNKKLKQRHHAQEKKKREELVDKMKPGLGNKYSKEKARKLLEKVTKESNVDKMDESGGSKMVKSSKAFFTQLQDEVQSHISSKVHKQKKLSKPKAVAAKIKL